MRSKLLQSLVRFERGEGRGLEGSPSTHVGKLLLIKSLAVTSGFGMADKSLFTVTKVAFTNWNMGVPNAAVVRDSKQFVHVAVVPRLFTLS